MDVRLPDGTVIQGVPDGTTKAQLVEKLKANGMPVPSEWLAQTPEDPKPQEGLTRNNSLAAQLGLTARAGVKALASIPAMFNDAVGGAANAVQDKVIGPGQGFRFRQTMPMVESALDSIGLPRPDTPTQRIVSQGVELGFGAGLGAKAADRASQGASAFAKNTLERLAADPTKQIASATGAGIGGEHAKESGHGVVAQVVSSMLGGLGGWGGVSALEAGKKAMLPSFKPVDIDQRINVILNQQGIDPADLNPAIRGYLRDEVTKALEGSKSGTIDSGALARLTAYANTGATPTRARVSLNPFEVTQERNAEKLAANLGVGGGLPQITQDNNARLLRLIDNYGPLPDDYGLGKRAQAPILSQDASMQGAKNALYKQAEGMAGGDIPLERGPVMDSIFAALNKSRKMPFVPESVNQYLKAINGDVNSPFDVNVIDNMKTEIATAFRSATDGNARSALGVIRDALDKAPLNPVKRDFGGNQLVTQGGASILRNADSQASELKAALDAARGANWDWRKWQQSNPIIERVLDGQEPEKFIKQNIVSNGFDEVSGIAKMLTSTKDSKEAIRSGLIQYLKDAAIGKGNESTTGNFSGRSFMSALQSIGDRKLGLFFDKDELRQLKDIGKVGITERFQPVGSAVNNSNTASAGASIVDSVAKRLANASSILPVGNELLSAPMNRVRVYMRQPPSSISGGLLSPGEIEKRTLDPLLMPMLVAPGLLSQ